MGIHFNEVGQDAEVVEHKVRAQLILQCLQAEAVTLPFGLFAGTPIVKGNYRGNQTGGGIVDEHLPGFPRPTTLKLLPDFLIREQPQGIVEHQSQERNA